LDKLIRKLEALEQLEKDSKLYIADKKEFGKFVEILHKVKEKENVRNVSAIMVKMLEICEEYYKDK
jgi:hypothetical protein